MGNGMSPAMSGTTDIDGYGANLGEKEVFIALSPTLCVMVKTGSV
jgi:hypothetical protein